MVCGGKLNCTAPRGAIQANPDIIGYGVLVSFILSALMTITAAAYAYLSDSIPEVYLSETDKMFIADFQKGSRSLLANKPFMFLQRCWLQLRRLTNVLSQDITKRKYRKLTRIQREEAVTRFILALSDQQLAVGLAILVATIANQCTLSVAEFRIAFALAWFSATTHLATLDSLQHYFVRHPTVRNWRVMGMLVLLILFIYCFVIILLLQFVKYDLIPVQCYFIGEAKFTVSESFSSDPLVALTVVAWIIPFIAILAGYRRRIFNSYGFLTSGVMAHGLISAKLKIAFLELTGSKMKELKTASIPEWRIIIEEATKEHWATRQQRCLELLKKPGSTLLQTAFRRLILAGNMYSRSMLPIIPSLAFLLVYGFAQMILYRVSSKGSLDIDSSMGFGQITPLLLLVVPILAAAEIYYESVKGTSISLLINENRDDNVPSAAKTIGTTPSYISRTYISADRNSSEIMGLEAQSHRYEHNLDLVKRYFYRESKEVQLQSASATTVEDYTAVLRRKFQLLETTQQLQEVENEFDVASYIKGIVVGLTLYAMTGATLLNVPTVTTALVVALTVVIVYGFSIMIWVFGFYRLDINSYVRILAEVRTRTGGSRD